MLQTRRIVNSEEELGSVRFGLQEKVFMDFCGLGTFLFKDPCECLNVDAVKIPHKFNFPWNGIQINYEHPSEGRKV